MPVDAELASETPVSWTANVGYGLRLRYSGNGLGEIRGGTRAGCGHGCGFRPYRQRECVDQWPDPPDPHRPGPRLHRARTPLCTLRPHHGEHFRAAAGQDGQRPAAQSEAGGFRDFVRIAGTSSQSGSCGPPDAENLPGTDFQDRGVGRFGFKALDLFHRTVKTRAPPLRDAPDASGFFNVTRATAAGFACAIIDGEIILEIAKLAISLHIIAQR